MFISKMFRSFLAIFLVFILANAQAYFITVDAHAEECFFDKVEIGTKLGTYVTIIFILYFLYG